MSTATITATPLSVGTARPVTTKRLRVHFYNAIGNRRGVVVEDGRHAVAIVPSQGQTLRDVVNGEYAEIYEYLTRTSRGWCLETCGGDEVVWFTHDELDRMSSTVVDAPYRRDAEGRYWWRSREALADALFKRRHA